MKNTYLKTILTLSAFAFMLSSCNEDDNTGHATLSPASPTLSVALDFANDQTLIEQDATYNFTVSLSEPQVVDVKVNLSQTGGTATDSEDFEFPHSLTIPKGATSVSGEISIFADELAEDTETAIIKIATGIEANVQAVNSETVSFTIMNLTADDLLIDFTWTSSTSFTDNLGNPIAGEDVADLEFLVTDTAIPHTQTFASIDNEFGFEQFLFESIFPDGEYHLVGQFYDAVDFGSNYTDLNLSVDFNQTGIINGQNVTIPGALNTEFASCQATVLAKVVKTGNSYVITAVGANDAAPAPVDGTFAGDYIVATTASSGNGFGAQFDGPVTIVDEGNGVRSFEGDWNGFGVIQTYEFAFDPICGTVTFLDDQNTGLACPGEDNITHGSSSNAGGVDPLDDTVFSITYSENTSSGCGGGPNDATITFTKV